MNQYVRAAIGYAEEAIANENDQHGKRIIKAAKRFLRDYARTDADWYFDAAYAFDACAFIEQLPHVEGRWATPTIKLEPFQCFALVQLFGFRKRTPTRNTSIKLMGEVVPYRARRFTSILYCTARKSAKSTIAASVSLYILAREQEDGQQLYSAANTFQQAMPIWGAAKKMIEKCTPLRDIVGMKPWAQQITRSGVGFFKPLHAKASSQDGLNPSMVAFDEVHAAKTPDLIAVLTSAAGARTAPLFAYYTTEGYLSAGPWAEMRQFADNVLDGIFDADHHLVLFWSIDKEDEDFDESAWIKANPLMLTNPHLLTAIKKEAEEAKGMPSKRAEFRIKRLNRESNPPDAWVDLEKWQACGDGFDLQALRSVPCWAALDLASVRDLCSFRAVWKLDEGRMVTWGRRWVPEHSVHQRTERGTVPYAGWVAAGFMEQIPGEVIDHAVIIHAVREFASEFNLQACAYDPWNAAQVAGTLLDCGIEMLEFVQGPKSFHPAMNELERLYIGGKLAHGNDPVLNWCAANLIARRDVNLNQAPDKKRAPDKVDDMVALLMAVGISIEPDQEGVAAMIGNTVK